MIRIVIALFCALGLALAPVGVANAHADPTMRMSDCAMRMAQMNMHGMHHGSKQHNGMDCCSPVCHAPAPVAIAAPTVGESDFPLEAAHFDAMPAKHLVSAAGSTTDPPPRT